MLPYAVVTALVVSMATIPVMARIAPRIGMVDIPDARKVHSRIVPRVGGFGIFGGALVSILLWVPLEPWLVAYLFGAAVLFVFGALDDRREMGHYAKFAGQFIAAVGVVYWGDVWVSRLPFMDGELNPLIGKPFTVFAIVGMVNAINHSDGLDGLAGGESLMSLGCLAWFGYLAGAPGFVLLAAAVGGGVFGFLRYNTHPAGVFMGDAGSQFLGFSLGVMAVVLTQEINPALSMAIPALILGLPIVDILAVFAQRARNGMNLFRATRNHIHHRLLELGFHHYQAVTLIYLVQAALVTSALVFAYASDGVVAGIYLGITSAVFAALAIAERRGWRVRREPGSLVAETRAALRGTGVRRAPATFLALALPAYLVAGSAFSGPVSPDFVLAAAAIATLCIASLVLPAHPLSAALFRVAAYSGLACTVYLVERTGLFAEGAFALADAMFFLCVAGAVGLAIRLDRGIEFSTTPLDLLLIFGIVGAGLLIERQFGDDGLGSMILRVGALFYACELLIATGRRRVLAGLQWSLLAACGLVLTRSLA